jgi:hypothetical protein
MSNLTMDAWVSEISRMTCIREGVVRQWMDSHDIIDFDDLRVKLGEVYPGPSMARAATRAILGW